MIANAWDEPIEPWLDLDCKHRKIHSLDRPQAACNYRFGNKQQPTNPRFVAPQNRNIMFSTDNLLENDIRSYYYSVVLILVIFKGGCASIRDSCRSGRLHAQSEGPAALDIRLRGIATFIKRAQLH